MSDNRWQRVEDIFHQAVDLAPQARSAFLDEACAADQSLRREVESLLAYESESGTTFAGPAGDGEPKTIAHYRISGKLGQGGMGAVYRATDTKLGREVAIKVLPRSFAEDADRMGRFTREAKVLASLNHPHIAQIYGLEDRALVMELVPGETLKGPLVLSTVLNYAKQITEALEAAHEKGIVHRDLKPANIVVTPEGVVKLLDFGLASIAPPPSGGNPLSSPTITMQSVPGMIMGTAAYMSPEQAAGKPVDKRADVWSFGAVLWELLTGHRLFEGETVSLTLAGVLRGSIDFDKLPRETPPAIRRLLRRCLDRDVRNRLRDIGEARIAIETALASGSLDEDAPDLVARRPWLAWSVAGLLAVGIASIAYLQFREKPLASAPTVRFQIPPPENAPLGTLLNVSPDGSKLAFLAGGRLWVHFLESGESRNLTDGGGTPFWSPDSRFIAYATANVGKLKRIEATGGPSQTVTDFPGRWGAGAWNQDGLIVFSNRDAFFRVPSAGGVPVQITEVDPARQETIHYSPSFLPDGRHFFYTGRARDERRSAVYLGSVDATPAQQSSKPLVNSYWGARYAPAMDLGTGYMLFIREDTLMAQPFDNRRLELTGQATPVAEQIGDGRAFSASDNGVLVFQRTVQERQLTWNDREGKVLRIVGDPGDYRSLALSPDGTRAALGRGKFGQASNIWLVDLARGTSARFVFGSGSETDPVWSPDGSRIIFSSSREGRSNLYQKQVSGEKDEKVLLESSEDKSATSWSRDGRFVLYTVFHPKTNGDIWVLPLERDRRPVPFLVSEFNEQSAHFSPDAHWVAYVSNESGRNEIYVRSFEMNASGTAVEAGGRWPISNGGGTEPRWRSDGRELYYQSPEGELRAAEIATSPVFRAGDPQRLGLSVPPDLAVYAPADGKRFLKLGPRSSKPEPYTVVLNCQAGLKK